MIENVNGNIFNGSENIIAHQTNCLGVMGGGIALQVKNLYPEVYEKYRNLCLKYKNYSKDLLGYAQILKTNDGKYIANCFGQNNIGFGLQTDYESLKLSLKQVCEYSERNNLSIALPYKIGCGLAGGDWNIVEKIIEDIFDNSNVKCVIYNYQG